MKKDLYNLWHFTFTHLPLDKMTTISHMKFSDAFFWISFVFFFSISLKFVPNGPIHSNLALV